MKKFVLKRSLSNESLTASISRQDLNLPCLFDDDLKEIYFKHNLSTRDKCERKINVFDRKLNRKHPYTKPNNKNQFISLNNELIMSSDTKSKEISTIANFTSKTHISTTTTSSSSFECLLNFFNSILKDFHLYKENVERQILKYKLRKMEALYSLSDEERLRIRDLFLEKFPELVVFVLLESQKFASLGEEFLKKQLTAINGKECDVGGVGSDKNSFNNTQSIWPGRCVISGLSKT
jgi:hypothetical protein